VGNRTTWRWAVTLSALVLTAACGGQAKPEASSSRPAPTAGTMTTASSPATSSTPAIDPNIPTAARAHTPAGAEAFVRYFLTRFNAAWSGPQAGLISSLSDTECKTCANWEDTARDLSSKNRRYSADPFSLQFVGATTNTLNVQQVIARGVQQPRHIVDSAGHSVDAKARKELQFEFALTWRDGTWWAHTIRLVQ